MKNMKEFKNFKKIKKGNSLITEDVVAMGKDYRVRSFDVPTSLISAFKKKAKDSGKDISGQFADTEIAEFIAKYVQENFLTIDNLPLSVLGDQFSDVQVQTTQDIQTQENQPQEVQSQNIQAQETAQEIPAQEPQGQVQSQTQTQPQTQPQGQTQGQGQSQGQTQGQSQGQVQGQGGQQVQEI